MAEPTFNERMVAKLQALIEANPLADSVTVDGTTVRMVDALTRLRQFEARVAREQGARRRVIGADLTVGAL